MSSEEKNNKILHRELASAQKLADEKAVLSIINWLNDMEPFSSSRDKNLLISFSTGFVSMDGDGINPKKSLNVGVNIQLKLDGKVPSTKIEMKNKVKPLSVLRNNVLTSPVNHQVNALKYFNRLVIFAQREECLETAFEHELGPLPMSLFSQKTQLMNEADKASFVQATLKNRVDHVSIKKLRCWTLDNRWRVVTSSM